MNLIVTDFLTEISNDDTFGRIIDHSNLLAGQIVIALGGFEKVINLCLTHNDSITDEQYCQDTISSLRALILINEEKEVNNETTNINTNNNLGDTKQNHDQIRKTATKPASAKVSELFVNRIASGGSHNHNNNSNSTLFAENREQFDAQYVVLHPNIKSNICYRLLSDERADWCINMILHSKWYNYTIFGLAVFFGLTAELTKVMDQFGVHSVGYLVCRISASVCALIWLGSWISSMNFDVIEIIVHTFDFWFKLWNMVLWLVSFFWMNIVTSDRYLVDLTALAISISMGTLTASLLDAIPIAYKVKRIVTLVVTVGFILGLILSYFGYTDVLYNPFEKYNFKHTQISSKNYGIIL